MDLGDGVEWGAGREDFGVYLAFMVWDGGRFVSIASAIADVGWGIEIVANVLCSCPSEAQCLCDVYNIGVCNREL